MKVVGQSAIVPITLHVTPSLGTVIARPAGKGTLARNRAKSVISGYSVSKGVHNMKASRAQLIWILILDPRWVNLKKLIKKILCNLTAIHTCHHVTGQYECQPGYTGLFCQQPCPVGTWGPKCSQTCACKYV